MAPEDVDQAEERGVSLAELSAGVTLRAGHRVILLVGGAPGTPGDGSGEGTGPGEGTGDVGGETGATGAPGPGGDGTADTTGEGTGDTTGEGTGDGSTDGTAGATSDSAQPGTVKVQLVSGTGKPRPNVVLEWTLPDATKRSGKTDTEGGFTLDDELPSSGECTLDLPDVTGAAAQAAGGHTAYAPGMKLAIGSTTVIELPPRVQRAKLRGLHFETDKTFLLPTAMRGIRQLRKLYDSFGALAVLVSGHTDTVGAAAYNRGLSEERAVSIAGFLTENADAWLANYQPPAHSKAWGTREDQYMLSELKDASGAPYYQDTVDGKGGTGTQGAWRRFQGEAGLPQSGSADAASRRALVVRYQALDGTTLPKDATLATHGCGLAHPAVPTGPGVDNADNRRVEIYLFGDTVTPPPQTPCPPGGCAEYAAWSGASLLTVDLDAPPGGLVVQVKDPSGAAVEGADVHLAGPAASDGKTGADGNATFPELLAGKYKVIVSKAGAQASEAAADVAEGSSGSPATVAVQLASEPPVAASLSADTSSTNLLETGTFVLSWKVDHFVPGTPVTLTVDRDPDGQGLTRPAACEASGAGTLKVTLHATGKFVFRLSVAPPGAGASSKACTVTFEPAMKIHDIRPLIP